MLVFDDDSLPQASQKTLGENFPRVVLAILRKLGNVCALVVGIVVKYHKLNLVWIFWVEINSRDHLGNNFGSSIR